MLHAHGLQHKWPPKISILGFYGIFKGLYLGLLGLGHVAFESAHSTSTQCKGCESTAVLGWLDEMRRSSYASSARGVFQQKSPKVGTRNPELLATLPSVLNPASPRSTKRKWTGPGRVLCWAVPRLPESVHLPIVLQCAPAGFRTGTAQNATQAPR